MHNSSVRHEGEKPAKEYNSFPDHTREEYIERREEFLNALAECGQIDRSFIESGVANRFDIVYETGMDALVHILVGDREGGAHHANTVMALGYVGCELACRVYNPTSDVPFSTQYTKNRKQQRKDFSGSYRLLHVRIKDFDEDARELITYDKLGGSSIFPDEWTASDVLNAAIEVGATPPVKKDPERQANVHVGEVRGVKIQVVTNAANGKILTACPR